MKTVRRAVLWGLAAAIFVFTWLLRFNDPGGSFAGLTDDHFFYLARGWQILFGDLPVRDFVDHGAPLYFYIGAAIQEVFGRGTLSELAFSVSMLSLAAALVFWLSAEASGWIALGFVGMLMHVLLEPRFYNYPKLLVYAAAIPLLWRFTDRPSIGKIVAIAAVTVVGFLLRHDHGVFVGLAMAVTILLLEAVPWRAKLRHAVIYGAVVIGLLLPYLAFIELNGGVVSYFQQAEAWAERDRDRAPVVWPGLFENPDGVSDAAKAPSPVTRLIGTARDNRTAWIFYAEIALPFLALALLAVSRQGFRPSWPHARSKLTIVAVLALILDAGFLRSPLEARLADPSVPLAILAAWLVMALPQALLRTGGLRPRVAAHPWAPRLALLMLALPVVFTFAATLSQDFYRRLDKSALTERFGKGFERASGVARQLRTDWRLEAWLDRPDRPALIDLSMYVNACTRPTDRVLVQAYMPQVLAMARRAFAGGHADLRPGFFKTDEAQALTLSRLERQSVPIVLLETEQSLANFRKSFPRVTAYLDAHYRPAGSKVFDGRFGVTLFVRTDAQPTGTYEPFGWPCYGSGVVRS